MAQRDFRAAQLHLGKVTDLETLMWMKPVRLHKSQVEAMIYTLESSLVAEHVKWNVESFHKLTCLACKLPHTKVLEDTAVTSLFRWMTDRTIIFSRV